MSTLVSFITDSFLQSILKDYFKCDIEVTHFSILNDLGMANSYCSKLIRVAVSYLKNGRGDVQELSLIGKIESDNEFIAEARSIWNWFTNEVDMYANVLPLVQSYDKLNKISANAIYTSLTPKPIIFLEDLSVLGFRSLDQVELPLDHILLALEKLAYLHAASVAVYEKDPKLVTKYKTPMYADNDTIAAMFSASFPTLNEVCQTIPELQKYARKMSLEKITRKLYSGSKPGKFNVLNHGDAWTNNFMYRYDQNGKLADMVIVDFQIPVFTGPGVDLQYFWINCTSVEMKQKGTALMLEHYHRELKNSLLKLQVKTSIPTSKEITEEFNSKSATGFATIITNFPVFLGEKSPDFSLQIFYDKDDPHRVRHNMFNNKQFIDHIKVILPLYDKLGLFD